jgi:N-methylhydantoinase A/oxoprolinase/acetone carboxylase beta subunit
VVHGYPIKAPMLDIHTVGAGGGSIAFVDSGGLLKVGPKSAGADPGPACYDRGNHESTVTDAHVVLGTLNPTHLLGGRMHVRQDLARGDRPARGPTGHRCTGHRRRHHCRGHGQHGAGDPRHQRAARP